MIYLRILRLCVFILFLELLLVRLLSTELSVLAYLQNSILVSCFLGLGMGLIAPKPKDNPSDALKPLAVILLLISVPFVREGARSSALGLSIFHDFLVWNEMTTPGILGGVTFAVLSLLIVFSILALCWGAMVPLGAELGRLFATTPERLKTYSADIFGSLLGVLIFTSLAYFSLEPVWWIVVLVALALLQPSCRAPRSLSLLALLLGFAVLGKLTDDSDITVWTPYQKLQFAALGDGGEWKVTVNNSGYQQIQNNSAQYSIPRAERSIQHYNLPSRLAYPPRRALVVGAGTGNDVAGLLAHSDADIKAVDIDPVLLRLGRQLHPEAPYANPRVHAVENDARAIFLNDPPKTYDLIVFGLLDSHTTPNLSNARLDNFVYTREALQAAKHLLTDDGILCLIFQLQRPYVAARIRNLLEQTFGQQPLVFNVPGSEYGWGGTAFVVGDQARLQKNIESDPLLRGHLEKYSVAFDESTRQIPITTDNWPYLYIEKPSVPTLFFALGAMFLILWLVSSRQRYGYFIAPDLGKPDEVAFVMLGISFSLVQVFSINKASILFGSTWFVNSAVISGILIMILFSNVVAAWLRPSYLFSGIIVVILTAGLGLLPLSPLLEYPMAQRALLAGLISGLPLFFSGILFATAFERAGDPGRALGANLFGAMLGGILQLVTFRWGIASTIYLAAFFYLCATIFGTYGRSSLDRRSLSSGADL